MRRRGSRQRKRQREADAKAAAAAAPSTRVSLVGGPVDGAASGAAGMEMGERRTRPSKRPLPTEMLADGGSDRPALAGCRGSVTLNPFAPSFSPGKGQPDAMQDTSALEADDVLGEQSSDEEDSMEDSASDDTFTGRDRPRWAEDYSCEGGDSRNAEPGPSAGTSKGELAPAPQPGPGARTSTDERAPFPIWRSNSNRRPDGTSKDVLVPVPKVVLANQAWLRASPEWRAEMAEARGWKL